MIQRAGSARERMRQELWDVLQAVDEAVKDAPPAAPGRVPLEDWDGWETVLAVLGLTDKHRVMALAREAVARIQQQQGAGEAETGPPEAADGLEDSDDGVGEGNVTVGFGARIVCSMQVGLEEQMFKVWSPTHGGLLSMTEAALRAEFKGAAESMLNSWQAQRSAVRSRASAGAGEFNPAGAQSILRSASVPRRRKSARSPLPGSPLTRSAQRQSGQRDSGRQQARRGSVADRAPGAQLPVGGEQVSPRDRMPSVNRPAEGGAASPPNQDIPRPEGPPEQPRGQRPQPRQEAPPVHPDDRDPNSSYCNPEAAAALWKTFTEAFARAVSRKQQALQEQVILERHVALSRGRRAHRTGRKGRNAGADLEEDDGFAEEAPRQQPQLRRRCAAAAEAAEAAAQAAPEGVGAGAAAGATGAPQRRGSAAAAAGAVPSDLAAQVPRPEHQEGDAEEEEDAVEVDEVQERQQGGRRRRTASAEGGDVAEAHADGGATQRPEKRRRQERDEGGAADRRGSGGMGDSPAQPQAAAPGRHQPQPVGEQPPAAAASPDLPVQTPDSPTHWSSATSAGTTISDDDMESLGTPVSGGADIQSPTPTGAHADEAPMAQHAEPEQPRYRPAIVPDVRAQAAWKKLGQVLRACRAAAAAQQDQEGGAARAPLQGEHEVGVAQQAAARHAGAPPEQLPDEREPIVVPDSPGATAYGDRTPADGAAGATGGGAAEVGGVAASPGSGTVATGAAAAASPGGAAAVASDTADGPQPPRSQLHQPAAAYARRRVPESLVHRGLPRTPLEHGATGTLPSRGAMPATQAQPVGSTVAGCRGASPQQQQPEVVPTSGPPTTAPVKPRSQGGSLADAAKTPAPNAAAAPSPARSAELPQAPRRGGVAGAPAANVAHARQGDTGAPQPCASGAQASGLNSEDAGRGAAVRPLDIRRTAAAPGAFASPRQDAGGVASVRDSAAAAAAALRAAPAAAAGADPGGCGLGRRHAATAAGAHEPAPAPSASLSSEELACGQRQGPQPDLTMGHAFAPRVERRAAPRSGAAAAGFDASRTTAAAQHGPQPRDGSALDPGARAGDKRRSGAGAGNQARDPQRVVRVGEGERKGPPKDPPPRLVSQGVQTSPWLLDTWVLGMQQQEQLQPQEEPRRQSVAVQTPQVIAQQVGAMPPPPPRAPSQPRQVQQQQQRSGHLGPAAPTPAVRGGPEGPPASADQQPLGSQAPHANQAGTVAVGGMVAEPHRDGQQRAGKRPHPERSHQGAQGSSGRVPAAEPSATPAVRTSGAAARVQPGGEGPRAQERPAGEGGAAAPPAAAGPAGGAAGGSDGGALGGRPGHGSGEPSRVLRGPTARVAFAQQAGRASPAAANGPARPAAAAAAQAAAARAPPPPPRQDQQEGGAAGERGAVAPRFGRIAGGGAPVEYVRAWMGRRCAPLMAPTVASDVLDVRNRAVGITSWPDIAMTVLPYLHSTAPPRSVAQRLAAGGGQWHDYWLAPVVPTAVQDVEELRRSLPMARDVLGAPPRPGGQAAAPAATVPTLEEAMRVMARRGVGVDAGADAQEPADAADNREQPE